MVDAHFGVRRRGLIVRPSPPPVPKLNPPAPAAGAPKLNPPAGAGLVPAAGAGDADEGVPNENVAGEDAPAGADPKAGAVEFVDPNAGAAAGAGEAKADPKAVEPGVEEPKLKLEGLEADAPNAGWAAGVDVEPKLKLEVDAGLSPEPKAGVDAGLPKENVLLGAADAAGVAAAAEAAGAVEAAGVEAPKPPNVGLEVVFVPKEKVEGFSVAAGVVAGVELEGAPNEKPDLPAPRAGDSVGVVVPNEKLDLPVSAAAAGVGAAEGAEVVPKENPDLPAPNAGVSAGEAVDEVVPNEKLDLPSPGVSAGADALALPSAAGAAGVEEVPKEKLDLAPREGVSAGAAGVVPKENVDLFSDGVSADPAGVAGAAEASLGLSASFAGTLNAKGDDVGDALLSAAAAGAGEAEAEGVPKENGLAAGASAAAGVPKLKGFASLLGAAAGAGDEVVPNENVAGLEGAAVVAESVVVGASFAAGLARSNENGFAFSSFFSSFVSAGLGASNEKGLAAGLSVFFSSLVAENEKGVLVVDDGVSFSATVLDLRGEEVAGAANANGAGLALALPFSSVVGAGVLGPLAAGDVEAAAGVEVVEPDSLFSLYPSLASNSSCRRARPASLSCRLARPDAGEPSPERDGDPSDLSNNPNGESGRDGGRLLSSPIRPVARGAGLGTVFDLASPLPALPRPRLALSSALVVSLLERLGSRSCHFNRPSAFKLSYVSSSTHTRTVSNASVRASGCSLSRGMRYLSVGMRISAWRNSLSDVVSHCTPAASVRRVAEARSGAAAP